MLISKALLVLVVPTFAQIYADSIAPIPVFHAAKILNTTENDVQFAYQFEDDTWRRGTIVAGKSVYIFDADPNRPLTIHLHDRFGTRTFLLNTDMVLGNQESRTSEPDLRRYDQAEIYYAAQKDGRIELFNGLPTEWSRDAVSSAIASSKKLGIDVSLFRDAVDVATVDPIYVHAEFARLQSVLGAEYAKFMKSSSPPELEIRWRRVAKNNTNTYVPQILVVGDCDATGTKFYRQIVESVLGRTTEEMRVVSVCKVGAGTTIRRPFLNDIYVRGNTILLTRMVDDMVNELRRHSLLGATKVVRDDNTSYTIFGNWNYGAAKNSQYAWRVIIHTSIRFDENEQAGVSLSVDVEARKRYQSSSKWNYLSQFAVANLETFPESSFSVERISNEKNLVPLQSVSKAARLCSDIEQHLSRIVAPRFN